MEEYVAIPTLHGLMNAWLSGEIDGRSPKPAIVLFQEAYGINQHIKHVCRRLAREGFIVLAPELYHRYREHMVFSYGHTDQAHSVMGLLTNENILEDAHASWRYLAHFPGVDAERIGFFGFDLGGFAAMLSACHLPASVVVSFYAPGMTEIRPGMSMDPILSDLGRLDCPALLHFGNRDPAISLAQVAEVREQLAAHSKAHAIVIHTGAGHGFFCDKRPSYHAASARAAWGQSLAWLRENLRMFSYRDHQAEG